MNNEFKKITQDNITRYVLESDGGTTSSGSIASNDSAGFKKGLLLTREGNKKTEPPKTRNPVAKNAGAAIGGGAAGAHKDKKKNASVPRKEKHKKPYMEALQARLDQLKSKVAEGNEWQGNRGNSQAGITDHTFDEAKQYIKGNYPFHKTYNVSRVEPGMRYHANPEKVANKTQSLVKGIDSALDYLQVKQNPMMSGSTQVTPSIGYSWHTHESRANGIAVLYYEDRGMGNDTITIAAKDRNNLKGAVQVCRDAGVIPLPKVKEQGVAEGFNGEYDDEAGMAQSNLLTTARAVMGLLKTIKDRDNLPEWGQEKIAKAEMMLVSVWDYLQSQKAMGNDPQQGVAEGLGDSGFNAMMGKITDPAARESLLPVEIQKVVQFLKGSIESLIEVLKSDPDFQPNDVRNSTDLRDMRKNLKSVMVDSDPKNVANAIFNYETEWRETMNEWAEEALGIELFTKLQNLYYGEYGEGVAEGNLNEIKKGAKDSNGFTKCWPSKHAVGTKKGKNGGQVRNCQPNESADSYFESLTNKLAEKLDPNAPVDDWVQDFAQANPEKYHQFRQNNRPGTRKPEKKIERMAQAASYAAKTGK